MRQSSPKRRPTSPEDRARLDWLHAQPCVVTGRHPVDIHHSTVNRGLGQKSPHDQGIPLHHDTHMDFHAATGYFKGWDREQRRAWQTAMVERYQTLWAMRVDARPATTDGKDVYFTPEMG
jgi:hypothetical protein